MWRRWTNPCASAHWCVTNNQTTRYVYLVVDGEKFCDAFFRRVERGSEVTAAQVAEEEQLQRVRVMNGQTAVPVRSVLLLQVLVLDLPKHMHYHVDPKARLPRPAWTGLGRSKLVKKNATIPMQDKRWQRTPPWLMRHRPEHFDAWKSPRFTIDDCRYHGGHPITCLSGETPDYILHHVWSNFLTRWVHWL